MHRCYHNQLLLIKSCCIKQITTSSCHFPRKFVQIKGHSWFATSPQLTVPCSSEPTLAVERMRLLELLVYHAADGLLLCTAADAVSVSSHQKECCLRNFPPKHFGGKVRPTLRALALHFKKTTVIQFQDQVVSPPSNPSTRLARLPQWPQLYCALQCQCSNV